MFSYAKKTEDVNVYIEGQPSLWNNLEELIIFKINGVSVLKANMQKSAAIPDVSMIDLKINIFGPIEDQVYSTFPSLIKNIRRGNTILRLNDKLSFGRKGLEKFFDLRYEHISPEQRYDDTCLDSDTHMHKNYILAGCLKSMLQGSKVEVVKTLKANGENV